MSERNRRISRGAGLLFYCLLIAVFTKPAAGLPQESPATSSAAERDLTDDFQLPEGLEATLWAESPQLYNPTNIDIDAKGRVWVVEAVNYRDFNNPPDDRLNHPRGERIVILEDTDGDGAADSSKVFVQDEDLVSPLGIAVLDSQVVVSSSPSIFVYRDTDEDDRADEKEVFLTGFGGVDHDHGVHAVTAGPDGRWYFNTGNAGPHVVTDSSGWTLRAGSIYTGGTPYNTYNQGGMVSDDGRVYTGGLALRIHRSGRALEVLSHNYRNPYELAVDSYGRLWTNDNDDQVVTCRTMWVMNRSNAGYFSSDGTRRWQADRRPRQDAFTAHWHQDDPGVIPAGDNTGAGSPTGITVYESDKLGPEYRGMVLSADAGRNVVFGYPNPQMDGAGYSLERSTFLSSLSPSALQESIEGYVWNEISENERNWFRPSDVAVGTDGAVYVADWYDPVVGGHQMRDREAYGRIYRITPSDKELSAPEIDLNTTEGQIEALSSPAANVRYSGFIRLKTHGSAVVDEVQALLNAGNPFHRARATWLLAHLGAKGIEQVEELLEDEDPEIRAAAFRALQQVERDTLGYARQLAGDPSPAVRREAAIALEDVSLERSRDIIMELTAGFEGDDRWYLEALGTALKGKEEEIYPALLDRFGASDPLEWSAAFSRLVWRLHPVAAVDALKERARAPELSSRQRQQAIVALGFIEDPRAVEAMLELSESDRREVAEHAAWWIEYRKTNEWRPLWDWDTEDRSDTPTEMLDLRDIVSDANLDTVRRTRAAVQMAADPTGGRLLLGLASEQELPPQIEEAIAGEIFSNPSQTVRVLAAHTFDRPDGGEHLSPARVAELEGNPSRGEKLFYSSCASCHRVGSIGQTVGPDLTRIRRKLDRTGLTRAIVEPNETVAHDYQPVRLTTREGTVDFGFLLADGPSVVLQDTEGQRHVTEAEEIVDRKRLEVSLMPDAQELGLSEQDVADLTRFLMEVEISQDE